VPTNLRTSGLVLDGTRTGPVMVDATARLLGTAWSDLYGNVRSWTADGRLVGGGWLDDAAAIRWSQPLASVPTSVRHPLCGLRVQGAP
jgi:hypothetical protein